MKDLIVKIQENFDSFQKNAEALVEKGNKAAGVRARKVSLELGKLLKEFRSESVK